MGKDTERLSFPAVHAPYYYQIWTGRGLKPTLAQFACANFDELCRLVPEVFTHTQGVDEFQLRKRSENTASLINDFDLVKLSGAVDVENIAESAINVTEEARQTRVDLLDAGDENAALPFTYTQPEIIQQRQAQAQAQAQMHAHAQAQAQRRPAPMSSSDQYSNPATKRHRGNTSNNYYRR